jgi:beta-amylase
MIAASSGKGRFSALLLGFLGLAVAQVSAGRLERAAVMAPLLLKNEDDWKRFSVRLSDARSLGVDAVSTDVWWGLVEASGDQQFDWSYYDRLSDTILAADLQWVPILSFHECGSGHGDDAKVPLPSWLWSRFSVAADDLRYRSEQGRFSSEVLCLWADPLVAGQYREFMEAFARHFEARVRNIAEINVSCGPTGELRYPSYNLHDTGADCPNRGALQCYGRLAVADFRADMLAKYGSLVGLNQAWGLALTGEAEITPPSDAPGFFERGDYRRTAYGRDLFAWYNKALVGHGRFLFELADEVFDGSFERVPLGIKIPGVHWRMGDPRHPRVAEMCAGLVPTDLDYQSDATAHGYAPILDLLDELDSGPRRAVLHFTCLEMGNENWAPGFSQAENLVFWIATGARDRGVAIMGENARLGGVAGDFGWGRIDNAFTHASYTGFTVLRIDQVTGDDAPGRASYRSFIRKFQPIPHDLKPSSRRQTRRGPR